MPDLAASDEYGGQGMISPSKVPIIVKSPMHWKMMSFVVWPGRVSLAV